MREATVAVRRLRTLLDFAVANGASKVRLLKRTQIDPADLQKDDERLPFGKYVALMRAAQEACNDPAFALHFGEAVDLQEDSMVGMAGDADTLAGGGLALMNRYTRLDFDLAPAGKDRFRVVRQPGELWLVDSRPSANDSPELTECTFARMACTIRRFFGGRQLVRAVHVTHAEPSYRDEYDRIFQVPVTFDADKNALLLAEELWDTPPAEHPQMSQYASSVMTAHAEALLEQLARSDSMRGRVERALIPILHSGEVHVDRIASELGVTRQTLFRRLKAEGVTFERVLNELRHDLALHYLTEKHVSVSETAYLVGFADPASFSRAFKRWTGTTPRSVVRRKYRSR